MFPLWQFSVRVYAMPGVSAGLVGLQDEHGLDVNLLLACAWAGVEGPGRLSPAILRRCQAAVADWQSQVIQPLRALRRDLPPGSAGRRRVGAVELAAEHAEQLLLAGILGATPRERGQPARAATANLRSYCRLSGVELSTGLEATLHRLVVAATAASG